MLDRPMPTLTQQTLPDRLLEPLAASHQAQDISRRHVCDLIRQKIASAATGITRLFRQFGPPNVLAVVLPCIPPPHTWTQECLELLPPLAIIGPCLIHLEDIPTVVPSGTI